MSYQCRCKHQPSLSPSSQIPHTGSSMSTPSRNPPSALQGSLTSTLSPSLSILSSFSCILTYWQVIFNDQPTHRDEYPQKNSKFIIFATICMFLSFSFSSLISHHRMSKSSTTTAPKIPTPLPEKSAGKAAHQ